MKAPESKTFLREWTASGDTRTIASVEDAAPDSFVVEMTISHDIVRMPAQPKAHTATEARAALQAATRHARARRVAAMRQCLQGADQGTYALTMAYERQASAYALTQAPGRP